MNITSVTTMTTNPFIDATQSVTIQLTNTGDSPTFCCQEYDTAALILIVVIGMLKGLVVLGTFIDFICRMFSRRGEDLTEH